MSFSCAGCRFHDIQLYNCLVYFEEEPPWRLPHPVPNELAELIARRFRVIGEPTRIRLLDLLRDGEATVGELAAALDASQQNVSKHLAVLADIGIVGRRKDGNRVYYSVVDEGVFAPVRGRLRLAPAAVRLAQRPDGRGGLVTTVAAKLPGAVALEHPEVVGPSAGWAAGPPITSAPS